jgi:rubrerythrin
MAAQMEEKAANTYLALAEAVTNAEGKRHCMDLHREELSHRDALEKALRGLDMDDEDRTAL